jgi:hypothetical protein
VGAFAAAAVGLLLLSALLLAFLFEDHLADLLLRRYWVHPIRWRREAEQRADTLLRRWLSPAQLVQYKRTGRFEVVGSDTGKRYRIHRYAQMNIEELDERGAYVATLCFAPEGNLPVDDIMLAQKIALETDERAVLGIARPR